MQHGLKNFIHKSSEKNRTTGLYRPRKNSCLSTDKVYSTACSMYFYTIDLNNFSKKGKHNIGYQFKVSAGLPDFKMGVTQLTSQTEGKTPSLIENQTNKFVNDSNPHGNTIFLKIYIIY